MAALLFKLCGNSTLKYLKPASSSNTIGFRKANFRLTATNFKVQCKDQDPFTTRLALPPDYDNVVEFMCEAYYKQEPAVINIGLQGTEAPPVWRAWMLELVQAGYSIIAETPDNCIVGAALNCITDVNSAKKMQTLAKCCAQGPVSDILEFFAFVMESPGLWQRFCVSRIFEVSCLAVDKNYQGLGIAKRLIQESWYLARDCSFRLFTIDCNNAYCARIAKGFGWPMIWSIPFSQYVKNGEVVFRYIKEPHTVCQVFVDQLRYCKTYCLPYKKCKKVTHPPV